MERGGQPLPAWLLRDVGVRPEAWSLDASDMTHRTDSMREHMAYVNHVRRFCQQVPTPVCLGVALFMAAAGAQAQEVHLNGLVWMKSSPGSLVDGQTRVVVEGVV